MKKIGTIQTEEKACLSAFAAYPKASWAWCCHHDKHCEPLTEPAGNRIKFILTSKSKSEQAVRLRNFRPAKNADTVATAGKVYADTVATARKVYDDAEATVRKVYDDTVATARKVYDDAVAPAGKVYDDTVATARKVYDDAEATARKVYADTEATARKVYADAEATAGKPLRALHKKEWPNNTWNGKSIFK